MKQKLIAGSLLIILVASACVKDTAPAEPRFGKLKMLNVEMFPESEAAMLAEDEVAGLMDQMDFAAAEALVDARIGDSRHGTFMLSRKAELLARRNEKAQALDIWMQLITAHGWTPRTNQLRAPLLLSVELSRDQDRDQLANMIIAKHEYGFFDSAGLGVPVSGLGPFERLAYAYLQCGLSESFESNKAGWVHYADLAHQLSPTDIIVLVHSGVARARRDDPGDKAVAKARLQQAYSDLTATPQQRDEIKRLSYDYGLSLEP
jgi:hypothetical protein